MIKDSKRIFHYGYYLHGKMYSWELPRVRAALLVVGGGGGLEKSSVWDTELVAY